MGTAPQNGKRYTVVGRPRVTGHSAALSTEKCLRNLTRESGSLEIVDVVQYHHPNITIRNSTRSYHDPHLCF